jgi:hypothetical protein
MRCLDKAQYALIALQNLLFAESTILDMEIKAQSCLMVTNQSEVIAMKEYLELSIATKDSVENKLTKS